MARLFDNDSTDALTRADITSARFLSTATWTYCVFFRVENTAGDFRPLAGKWGTPTNERQFLIVVNQEAAPAGLDFQVDNSNAIRAASIIELNTWYCVVTRNDGSAGVGGLTGDIFNISGGSIYNNTGDHTTDVAVLTTQHQIGRSRAGAAGHDGEIAYVAYFNTELTDGEVVNYVHSPYAVVASKGSAVVEYFLPLISGDLSPEPDIVQGRNFTVVGAPAKGDNPPLPHPVPSAFLSFKTTGATHSSLGFRMPSLTHF